jgi:hypothetical protein
VHIVTARRLCEHDEVVMMMNEVQSRASGQVQSATPKVVSMIDEPGRSAGSSRSLRVPKETTMLKTISAALLAVSVLAAPAFAATSGKSAQAPVTKSAPIKTTGETTAKTTGKTSALNANAKMGHHSHHRSHKHHRNHKKMSALRMPSKSHAKVSFKHTAPAIKRG